MSTLLRRTACALFALVPIAGHGAPLEAQDASEGSPEGWIVRLDQGRHGGGELDFVDMPPGWHITTGPAGIFYNPEQQASGEYRVEAEVFLFDPGERREGYGVILGGQDLEGDDQSYTYFLIRRDGSFLIKQRKGSETATLTGWEESPAVVTWAERGDGEETALNVLAVEVGADEVGFFVNGEQVATLPKSEVDTDGVVGLRVNHSLNLHVARLEVLSTES